MNAQRKAAVSLPALLGVTLLAACTCHAAAQPRLLRGHVPAAVSHLKPVALLPASNQLTMAIGLRLRDPAGLKQFLRDVYDPASPHYRKYVTPEEFTANWGPTEEDYAAVSRFAQVNGLRVAQTHKNRMLLDVTGLVGAIEKAFRIKLQKYRHPTENRDFFAPDGEPAVAAGVPILDIEGLDNYIRPRRVGGKRVPPGGSPGATPLSGGSGQGGTFMAVDLRAAYAPAVTLDGTGQTVALVELDGYYPSDIIAYEQSNNLAHVTLTNVLIDGASGIPGSSGSTPISEATLENAMDIEMVIAMAPGISRVIIYQGVNGARYANGFDQNGVPHLNDLLNQIATDNLAKQISTSWFWGGGPAGVGGVDKTTDQIFQQMAAQGQSFFSGSGDGGAYWGDRDTWLASNHNDSPLVTSPYITLVGGTFLATDGAGGSWTNEAAWKEQISGTYTNSTTGATSTTYGIPVWQQGVDMSTNGGSTVMRNTPDLAMVAYRVFIVANGGPLGGGGTSAASPLWAGFMALVNQQAELHGQPPAGFINPAVYAIGQSSNYASCFHDITLGDNTSSTCSTNFFAVPGYDLCTGWGSPKGQPLIDALADPDVLVITPGLGFTAADGPAGPFNITNKIFVLRNNGAVSIAWSLGGAPAWLTASAISGTLPAGAMANVDFSLNASAQSSADGIYSATVWFTNVTSGYVQSRQFTLKVRQPLLENSGFEAGDFSGWKVLGWWWDGRFTAVLNNLSSPGPHSGNYFAALGPHYVRQLYDPNPYLPTFLSQTISTVPGQVYQISFWLSGFVSPSYGPSTEWTVSWGENTVLDLIATNLYSAASTAWTNRVVLATATTSETQLQFGLNGHFSLDDVTVSLVSNVAPIILTQPASPSPLLGSSYALKVLAAGTWPLAYHWRFNSAVISDDARKGGTSTAQLGITNASPQDIGSYDVIISNAYGAVTSAVAVVSLVGSNILVNGGFEAPVLAANSIATTLPTGWSGSAYVANGNPFPGYGPIVSDSLDWYVGPLETPLQGPAANTGQQYLGLDADYGLDTVTQAFQIVAAGDYQVSWYDNDLIWYALFATSTYSLGIFDGSGATVASTTFDAFNLNTVQGMAWRQRSLQVSLQVGPYALVFQKQPSSIDVFNPSTLIDDVAVRSLVTSSALPQITLQKPVFAPGSLTFGIVGTAGVTTHIDRARSLSGPWTNIGSALIGTNGAGVFQDTNPPVGSGFYRAVRP